MLGEISEVLITVCRITWNLTFLLVKNVPFGLIIGQTALKTKRAVSTLTGTQKLFDPKIIG